MTGWTLRRRLVVVLICLLAAVATTMAALSTLALQRSLVDQLDQRLTQSSDRTVGAEHGPDDETRPDGGPPDDDGPPPGLDAPGQATGTVTLSERDGVVRAGYIDAKGDVQSLDADQSATLAAVPPDGRPRFVDLGDLGRHRAVAATAPDGALVVTGLSTADAEATVRDYLLVEVLVALVGLLLAAVTGRWLVRRELRPLERVAATATRVSQLPLHQGEVALAERLGPEDTDRATEVGQVGAALNRLLEHVEGALGARHASETQVRQFVADASHELRTPLASIRGYAELVRRLPDDLPPDAVHAMERVEAEARRMTALVEDLLLLARLDAGRPLERAPVDLTALAVDAVADAHAASPVHRWRLDLPDQPDDIDSEAPALVSGDEDRLRQVLLNLLANARVHTPPGTTVTTSVQRSGDHVVLRVADDGPGIPEALRPQVFHRFSRADSARSPGKGSSGLGLAIVAAIVGAHDGTIVLEPTPSGSAFALTLPAADRPDTPT